MDGLADLFVYRDEDVDQPDDPVDPSDASVFSTPGLARRRVRRAVRIPPYLRDYITATLRQTATPSARPVRAPSPSPMPHTSPSSPQPVRRSPPSPIPPPSPPPRRSPSPIPMASLSSPPPEMTSLSPAVPSASSRGRGIRRRRDRSSLVVATARPHLPSQDGYPPEDFDFEPFRQFYTSTAGACYLSLYDTSFVYTRDFWQTLMGDIRSGWLDDPVCII
jgi:hypothetical protein